MQLVPSHAAAVLRVATALVGHGDAEDAAQEAMTRAWKAWQTLREAGAVRAWLLRITVNVCREWHRGAYGTHRRSTQPFPDDAEPAVLLEMDAGTSDHTGALDLRAAIRALHRAHPPAPRARRAAPAPGLLRRTAARRRDAGRRPLMPPEHSDFNAQRPPDEPTMPPELQGPDASPMDLRPAPGRRARLERHRCPRRAARRLHPLAATSISPGVRGGRRYGDAT